MIKKVLFGGIVRDPSARLSEAGECEQSINVVSHKGELAPIVPPTEITADADCFEKYGIPEEVNAGRYDVVLIHKGADYQNFICKDTNGAIGIWAYDDDTDTFYIDAFHTLRQGEVINDAVSIGNSIVIATDLHTHYVLWKNKKYVYLGTNVPMPKIRFEAVEETHNEKYLSDYTYLTKPFATDYYSDNEREGGTWYIDVIHTESSRGAGDYRQPHYIMSAITTAYNNHSVIDIKDVGGPHAQRLMDLIHSRKSEMDRDLSIAGIFAYPVWVSCGIKLFDGTTYEATPCLMSGGTEHPFDVYLGEQQINGSDFRLFIHIASKHAYKIHYKIADIPENFSDWSDIITSLDFHISTPIGQSLPASRAALIETVPAEKQYTDITHPALEIKKLTLKDSDYSFEKDAIDSMQLYLLKRYTYEEIKELNENTDIELVCSNKTLADQITPLEQLKDADFLHYERLYGGLNSVNNRLVGERPGELVAINNNSLLASKRGVAPKYETIIRSCPVDIPGNVSSIVIKYFEPDRLDPPEYPSLSQKYKFLMRYIIDSGAGDMVAGDSSVYDDVIDTNNDRHPYGLFMCPDSRATSVQVSMIDDSDTVLGRGHFNLKTAPAYGLKYYMDIESTLVSLLSHGVEPLVPVTPDNIIQHDNYIYQSEVDSPFSVLPTGKIRLSDKVLDIGVATRAMSEGQFGAFPVIAFTSSGIWALSTDDLGNISSSKLISEEILLEGTEVTPLEQAIIFISKSGVKLLEGFQVTSLAEEMRGKPYALDAGLAALLAGDSNYSRLAATIGQDTAPLMEYMKDAKAIYDAAGNRVLFFNNEKKGYQFLLSLDTKTWHTIQSPYFTPVSPQATSQVVAIKPLNSFPDVFVKIDEDVTILPGQTIHSTHIFNYSTLLDELNNSPQVGIAVTRPIDFDAPDVYKSVNRIKIRGIYPNAALLSAPNGNKFILLGSNDGVNFIPLHSLRGRSWKYFKLALLTELTSIDRVTYAEVEYEIKSNDKLR